MSKAFSFWTLILLLSAISISIKAKANNYSIAADEPKLMKELSSKLQRQGFATNVELHHFPESTLIGARGSCHLRITDGTRANQLASVLQAQSRELGAPKYYYRGQWSSEPPVIRSELERYKQLILARLNIRERRDVILAMSASPTCRRFSLDFSNTTIDVTG